MIVSALKKTSPDRILVEFEGGESLRSTLAAVTDARLYVGMELRDDEFAALKRSSKRGLERQKALELLSRRPHSRKELKDKLLRRGIDEEDAEKLPTAISSERLSYRAAPIGIFQLTSRSGCAAISARISP